MAKWESGYNEANEKQNSREISIKEFANLCKFEIIVGDEEKFLNLSSFSVNRPGLFLKGFKDYFASRRVQVIGHAESYFLMSLSDAEESEILENLFKTGIPCMILARGIKPSNICIKIAKKHKTPIFSSSKVTSDLVNDIILFLANYLAQRDIIQGELIDVGGVGILLTGSSGLGKSETALDLITRGNKLIADDVVEISNSRGKVVGKAPKQTQYYMEVRGIGIIDIRLLYGIGAVLDSKEIDLVIELTKWTKDLDIDRLGDEIVYQKILGCDIRKLTIPVAAGRNLANIVEVAARNFRLQSFGYSTLSEFLSGKI